MRYKQKKAKNILTNFNSKTTYFNGLRKIHKSEVIKIGIKTQRSEYIEITNPSNLTFRPIVAGSTCPIQKINWYSTTTIPT